MTFAQSQIVKSILVTIAVVAMLGGAVWLAFDWFHEQRVTARTDAYVQEIIAMLDLKATPDFHQQIDKVDAAFWANRGNPAAFANGLLSYAKRRTLDPVHMECSTRTNLMGLRSRGAWL